MQIQQIHATKHEGDGEQKGDGEFEGGGLKAERFNVGP